jgi:DNA invertase Pin-like site-specific DNA recombinase
VGNSQSLRVVIWAAVSTEAQAKDEKASLPAQVADARAWASANGHAVIDELVVPGFSRRYYNLPEFAAALKRETDNDAGERLLRYIRERAFDVFVCRDADRFGREQSMVSEVIARIIDSGARIYTLNEGWIDAQHYRMVSALTGIRAASYVDDLRRKNAMGMDKRARDGRPVTTYPPASHMRTRDERGKSVGFAPDPDARPLVDELARLLLEGIGYQQMASLINAMGFKTPRGGRWTGGMILRLYHNPVTWGHVARYHNRTHKAYAERAWTYDDEVSPPDGVIVTRNAHAPAWTGDIARQIRDELRRRAKMAGAEASRTLYRFSGVAICAECTRPLGIYYSDGKRRGVACNAARNHRFDVPPRCTNRAITHERILRQTFVIILQPLIDGTPDSVLTAPTVPPDTTAAVESARALEDRIAVIDAQLDRLIIEQSLAPADAQPRYRAAVEDLTAQRTALVSHLNTLLERVETSTRMQVASTHAADELRALTLSTLWTLPDREINALLLAILGNRRLVFRGDQLVNSIAV